VAALSPEPLPPRKKPSIFVWVLKIVGVVVAGISIALIWRVATSPMMNRMLRTMGEQQRLMQEQTTAPGARELRKSGPCAQVIITSPDVRRRLDALSSPRRRRKNATPANETVIVCMAPMLTAAPTCDALARTYVDAVHPADPFRMVVNQPANRKSNCGSNYDSSGSPVTIDGGI
jgi:hypothetical protein